MSPAKSVAAGDVELLERASALASGPLAERAGRYDELISFPFESYADLHEAGLTALVVPKQYGGQGAGWQLYLDVLRSLAGGCGSTALTFNMHSTIVRLVEALGSPEQKADVFGAVVEEGALLASLTSEPQSSLRGKFQFQTHVSVTEDRLIINGTKHFCSLAPAARWYFTWALEEDATRLEDGLLTVLVPADAPGVTVHETWNTMAMRATASHSVSFQDVVVPRGNQVGSPGELARNGLTDLFTPGYAAVYLGIGEAAFRFAVDYAKTTVFAPETVPISHFPSIQHAVGGMAVKLSAGRALVERSAEAAEAKPPAERILEFNQAKYFCCRVAREVADSALDVCGGRGLAKAFPLERFVRDAHAGNVMPPNADLCRELIGKAELGIDMTPGFLRS